MLTKLLKKDFQATSRWFLSLMLGFVVICALCKIVLEIALNSPDGLEGSNSILFVFVVLLFTFYIIYLIGYNILTQVFIVIDFYKSMVSEQAYLTHTLPVKFSTLLHSKLLIAVLWQIITGVMTILSIIFFFIGHFSVLITEMNLDLYFFHELRIAVREFESIVGMPFMEYIIVLILSVILGLFYSPLMFFVSIAIGHLFGKHRILGAIAAYLGMYSILQILSIVLLLFSGFFSTGMMSHYETIFRFTLWSSLLFSAATAFLFYILTNYIFTRKLNLE